MSLFSAGYLSKRQWAYPVVVVVYYLLGTDIVAFCTHYEVTPTFTGSAIPFAIVIPDGLFLLDIVDNILLANLSTFFTLVILRDRIMGSPWYTTAYDRLSWEYRFGIDEPPPLGLTVEYGVKEGAMLS